VWWLVRKSQPASEVFVTEGRRFSPSSSQPAPPPDSLARPGPCRTLSASRFADACDASLPELRAGDRLKKSPGTTTGSKRTGWGGTLALSATARQC
jgi:hypothetical protein